MSAQGKKFISPGAWFSLVYPADWNEFEDMEDSFLFYNPDRWAGNFRISAFRAENGKPGSKSYGKECINEELNRNSSACRVEVAGWECAYGKETFQEGGVYYTTHLWITGKDNIVFECSFTVPKGGDKEVAEAIISTLEPRENDRRHPAEIIPIRILEIGIVNEAFEWASSTVKKQLKKDFTAIAEDIPKIQQVVDNGDFKSHQREVWESLGIAFGTVLVNEMDGIDWVTVIDGSCEYPALQYEETELVIYPMRLIWEKKKENLSCDLAAEFESIKKKVEDFL